MSARARALLAGLAGIVASTAFGGAAGEAGRAPGTILTAQLDIPTSPSFRMNVGPGAPAEAVAVPIGSHDAPAKGAPGGARSKAAAGAARSPAASGAASGVARGTSGVAQAGSGMAQGAPGVAQGRSAVGASTASGGVALAGPSAPGAASSASGDSFERLRDRLAQVLGATSANSDGRYVMRVSNRGESGENVVSSARSRHVAAPATAGGATHGGATGGGADTSPATPTRETTVSGAGASPTHPLEWDYDGASGPASWSRLQPGFDKCATGTRQSPIDIRDGIAVDLEPIRFDYHPGSFTVVDTGRTVQVDIATGSSITVGGRRYALEQFHFHRPSEERIDGRRFDMTVHLVHRDADGRVAVVAVLLERGSALPVVQAVWNNLPLERNDPVQAAGPLDPAQLLPEDRRYYTYMGSLTTPPCTEGVLWLVMKRPVQISAEQDAIFARLYPMNARPLQAASGRLIKESQ